METTNEQGEVEAKILILSKKFLIEADVVTGVNVLKLDLKQLMRADIIESK